MKRQSFGSYLRSIRLSRNPQMTQEALAQAVGRSKMTISQFEQNKNAPPQGQLLDSFIEALNLNEEEEGMFRFLAAESRKTIPEDIQDYFFSHPAICNAIRAASKANADDDAWQTIAAKFSGKIG